MTTRLITLANFAVWIGLHFGAAGLFCALPDQVQAWLCAPERPGWRVGEGEMAFYRKIGLPRWKDRLPQYNHDFNKRSLARGADPAYLREFLFQTRKAELIHYAIGPLGYLSLLFSLLADHPADYLPLYLPIATVVLVCNLPFSLIQRYNRFRLCRTLERLERRVLK